jgi:hypothetical protein
MNAARVTVRAWTLDLHAALKELAATRLRWCVVCGRVGLWGWQPLCAAMPITWVCTDRARCRDRQAVRASRRERAWRRRVAWRRPGPARPPTGRPWRPAGLAAPNGVLDGPQARGPSLLAQGAVAVLELAAHAEAQAGEPIAKPLALVRLQPDTATREHRGDRR